MTQLTARETVKASCDAIGPTQVLFYVQRWCEENGIRDIAGRLDRLARDRDMEARRGSKSR